MGLRPILLTRNTSTNNQMISHISFLLPFVLMGSKDSMLSLILCGRIVQVKHMLSFSSLQVLTMI